MLIRTTSLQGKPVGMVYWLGVQLDRIYNVVNYAGTSGESEHSSLYGRESCFIWTVIELSFFIKTI